MIICLAEELHAAGVRKLAEAVDHFRSISLELLEGGSGDGECHLERSLVLLHEVEKEAVHRKVALLGNPSEDGTVGEVIVVMRILAYVEEPVKPESGRLVNLEIQA